MVELRDPNVFIPGPDATGLYNLYGVTPWKNLPLASGWSNVSGNATAQYRLTPGGRVVVKGLIQQTAILSIGATIATFPVGFRPSETRVVGLFLSSTLQLGTAKFFLSPAGVLSYQGTAIALTTIQVSLDQLEFDAEQ